MTATGARTHARTILVVDDDRHSREGLRDALLQEGHSVETAADAWQAITAVHDRDVDVAIVDLDLPPLCGVRLSGRDFARIFRAYLPAITLIVISAEDDAALRHESRSLRITEVLEKPISPSHVKAIVRGLGG